MKELMEMYLSPFEQMPVYIEDMLCDLIEEYDLEPGNKEIEFIIESRCDRPLWIMGSYRRLSILFYNLYKSAVDAIEEKGTIITTVEKTNKGRITVTIRDNGKAIKDRDKRSLGIAISKRIAMEYYGFVTGEATPEGGVLTRVVLGREGDSLSQ